MERDEDCDEFEVKIEKKLWKIKNKQKNLKKCKNWNIKIEFKKYFKLIKNSNQVLIKY